MSLHALSIDASSSCTIIVYRSPLKEIELSPSTLFWESTVENTENDLPVERAGLGFDGKEIAASPDKLGMAGLNSKNKNQKIGRLLHEIANPLNIAALNLELLESSLEELALEERDLQRIARIRSSIDNLVEVVREARKRLDDS